MTSGSDKHDADNASADNSPEDDPRPSVDDEGEDEVSALGPETEWVPNFPVIRKLDYWWYRLERWVCGGMFLIMTLLVFAAVVSDIFGTRRNWTDLLVLYGLVYLGVRTRTVKEGERAPSQPKSLVLAAIVTAVIAGLTYLYTTRYPGGFVFAQKLALVMMLWVALLGASLATYERAHLALEMGEKIWPRRILHFVKAFAHALTSAFCLALFYLSWNLISFHMDMPTTIKGNLWLSKAMALSIMPYTFAAMAIRLAAQSYTLARKLDEPKEEQLPT
jgi:TRAP-type C4-dicarboxylate transport system permease small subunit